MLEVCEIFKSIQGESTRAGLVCSFVRLSGCNLGCSYCDTRYAQAEGTRMGVGQIVAELDTLGASLVEVTGGEPLIQNETPELCEALLHKGYSLMVETNGSQDIGILPSGCIRIVDIKCPGSGEGESFLAANIDRLRPRDECKFVLCNREDFDWALAFVRKHALHERCPVLFSPVRDSLAPAQLAAWLLQASTPVRLGLQLHKIIWGPDKKGV